MKKLIISILIACCAVSLGALPSCSVVNNAGAGTVQISSGGTVTGSGTSFNASYAGSQICVSGTCGWIATYTNANALTLSASWGGTTASGQAYTITQIASPVPDNVTNTVTFPNNFQAGDTLVWAGWIDTTIRIVTNVVTGTGENLTFTPHSPTSFYSYYMWAAWLASTKGGSNTISAVVPGGDGLDDVWAMELNCTGGIPTLDTDGYTYFSGPPSIVSFSVSPQSQVVWAVGASTDAITGFSSPLTSGPVTTMKGVFGYEFGPSSPVSVELLPSTLSGAILSASLKLVPPQPIGGGATNGVGGSAGYNGAIGTLSPSTIAVCGNGTSGQIASTGGGTAASLTTSTCDTTGATLLTVGCSIGSTSDSIGVSDSQSNIWACLPPQNSGGFYGTADVCYSYNPTTSPTHTFTCTPSGTTNISVGAVAITGTPKTASVLDFGLSNYGTSASLYLTAYPSAIPQVNGTGILPKNTNEYIYMFCGTLGYPTATAMTSPFTQDSTSAYGGGQFGAWMGHYLDANGIGMNPGCSLTGITGIEGFLVGFQPANSRLPQATNTVFSPSPGTYTSNQTVSITASTGNVICYSTSGVPKTNGTTGCTTGVLYSGPITVSASETIYAVSGGTGYADSAVVQGKYVISLLIAHAITSGAGTITTSALNTTGATLLVACIGGYPPGWTAGSGTTGPITDSKSNTWNYLTLQKPGAADTQMQMAYAYNPTVGTGHTVTMTTTTFNAAIAVTAWAGTLTTSSVFDKQNGATNNSAASLATGTITPAVTNELLMTCWNSNTNGAAGLAVNTTGSSGGFTLLDSITGTQGSTLADGYYNPYGSISAIGATWTQTTAAEEGVSIVSFEP